MKIFSGVPSLCRKIHTQLFRVLHFSTKTKTKTNNNNNNNNNNRSSVLLGRISNLGGKSKSVVPVLDQWIEEGKTASKWQLHGIVKELSHRKRIKHALEVMDWMTDKRHLPVAAYDAYLRIKLIFRAYGLEQAENYFNNIPENLKNNDVYLALLNCYTLANSVDKAESIMHKARDLGYACLPVWYNLMMSMYYRLGNSKKVEDLLAEMEAKGISHDHFTLSICLSSCAMYSDTEGIDKIVRILESHPLGVVRWQACVTAVKSYLKMGNTDKALAMLKKLEGQLTSTKDYSTIFVFLLKLYAKAGKKDELHRVWNLYKQKFKIIYKVYNSMIKSLMLFGDIEVAEKIFEEWDSNVSYSYFKMANTLIESYCINGDLEKAEALVTRGISNGHNPPVTTWCHLAGVYLKKNEVGLAVEALKKAISICHPSYKSQKDSLMTCLKYLENGECMEKAEELIKLVSMGPHNIDGDSLLGLVIKDDGLINTSTATAGNNPVNSNKI